MRKSYPKDAGYVVENFAELQIGDGIVWKRRWEASRVTNTYGDMAVVEGPKGKLYRIIPIWHHSDQIHSKPKAYRIRGENYTVKVDSLRIVSRENRFSGDRIHKPIEATLG